MARALGLFLLALCLLAGGAIGWQLRPPSDEASTPIDDSPAQRERGALLALAGNCAGCHTAPGGAAYAGGRGIETPFGTVFAGNLTPDALHGIGAWSTADFWRAMHHGRSRDGRLLAPVFPYPNFTRIDRADSDALFTHLRSQSPVAQANAPHTLRWPYGTQVALAAWRVLFFTPGAFVPDPARSAEWNRGAYLVQGLGHCDACHAERNLLGATDAGLQLGGGLIPQQRWYAPALNAAHEAGVADWPRDEVVSLLRDGISARGVTLGPMAEVVFRSTQHLPPAELTAIASYLQSLPPQPRKPAQAAHLPPSPADGAALYSEHCADCHGPRGEGAGAAAAALAGNRALTMDTPANVVQMLLRGGFAPATAGNPRPYGMPPFGQTLDDAQIAALATHIRRSWGNAAPAVSPLEVQRLR